MKPQNRKLYAMAAAAALMAGLGSLAHAQAGDGAALTASLEQQSAPAATVPSKQMTIGDWLRLGGWCMWPLGACSLIMVGLTIYNAVVVRPGRMLRPDLVNQIQSAIEELDIERARNVCLATPTPMTNIVYAGLERIRGAEIHLDTVEKGMEESSMKEIAAHMQPIHYLSVIGTVAPMLGLLGTVSGMIKAFQNMALGGMGKPELLADNISEALITTEAGLIIGIPAMVIYFFFKNRFTSVVASINQTSGNLLESLRVSVNRAARLDEQELSLAAK